MKVFLHPEAETELHEAILYYESCETGLGIAFHLEVLSTIERINYFPFAWPVADSPIRRCILKRFPYAILYSVEEKKIFIVALMNLHKNPDYWKERI